MKRQASDQRVNSSDWWNIGRRLRRDRLALGGLVFVILLFALALFAPLLANNKPLLMKHQGRWSSPLLADSVSSWFADPQLAESTNFRDLSLADGDWRWLPPVPFSPTEYDLDAILLPPSNPHWLGTDDQGRDVASRLIYGTRVSISVGFVAVAIYVVIGIIIGAIAGYFGGWLDIAISRLIEVVICFPVFFLILTVLAFVGPSIYNIMVVIGVTSWTGIARLVRGEFLKNRQLDYIHAARVVGSSHARIMIRHILPNSLAPVLVSATFGVAGAILIESGLSFLGFGVQPPTASWGDILSQSRSYIDIAWWLTLFPGLAIFVTVTAYNVLGEGLRDVIDPRLQDTETEL